MAFLRAEKKKSGTYLRIVQSYREAGKTRHKTLYSLGKVEDYPKGQLERIAYKLLSLEKVNIKDVKESGIKEVGRYNYGYALLINELWSRYKLSSWSRKVKNSHKVVFNWESVLKMMIAERLNEPCSKRQSYFNQEEYIGFGELSYDLHHYYRCLDILNENESHIKNHLFTQQRRLNSKTTLDLAFYDVTTLYFDSQIEEEGKLRQKGYSKDGKAHKTQVVLGLLTDKLRNPLNYDIYSGNTYEGITMQPALKKLRQAYQIDLVTVVADSGMMNKENIAAIESDKNLEYIVGDRLKILAKKIQKELIDRSNHQAVWQDVPIDKYSYIEKQYKGRRLICSYSAKRAKKDAAQRQKLIDKAQVLLSSPSKYRQRTKKGAGRFIKTSDQQNIQLDTDKIQGDQKYDGFKVLSTNSKLPASQIIEKYSNLFEIEHAFRSLKSQLAVRPIFHWTDKRIKGHIAMCFIAYTFLNYLQNTTQLSQRTIVKTIDKMQMSAIKESGVEDLVYLRSKITPEQEKLSQILNFVLPKDTSSQHTVNQLFTK